MSRAALPRPEAAEDVRSQTEALLPELLAVRRELHRRPEPSFQEHATAARVGEWLARLDLGVRTGIGGTGVVADLEGAAPGPTLLLRADMDALPIAERTNLEFSSAIPGLMHACGHDVHTSALLGAASILIGLRDRIAGRVRFCFQPAEEILGGANAMIADGVMDGVDHVLGAHVDAIMPFGTVAASAGPFLAGADFFEIAISGSAGHAAMPHLTVDPLYVACQLVTAAQSIVSRETRPGERLVLSIGAIEGSTVANILVEKVVLRGTLRWFSSTERDRALARLEALMHGVCQGLRARGELHLTAGTPVTVNQPEAVEVLREALADCGRAELVDPGPMMGSDDVARLLERAPGAYFLVGARGSGAPHHHPEFEIDERVLGLICELLVRSALTYLKGPH